MSDVHLEFRSFEKVENPDNADVLVLAGDIFIADDFTAPQVVESSRYWKACMYRKFLGSAAANYKYVVYVAGNHEYYHGYWDKSRIILANECEKYNNVFFLDRDYVFIEEVLFLGATLWTDMKKEDPIAVLSAQDMMNDYKVIKNDIRNYSKLRVRDTVIEHAETVLYLKKKLFYNRGIKTVIVTHHAPSFASVGEEYYHSAINPAYYSDLEYLMYDYEDIALWCHGHIHSKSDYLVGMTRVVANPLGYPGEHDNLNPYKTVEI